MELTFFLGAKRRLVRRSSKSEGGSNPCLSKWRDGLLRGSLSSARIRATRWLAMTLESQSLLRHLRRHRRRSRERPLLHRDHAQRGGGDHHGGGAEHVAEGDDHVGDGDRIHGTAMLA